MKWIQLKSLIFIGFFYLSTIPAWAGQVEPKNSENLYYKALQAYMEKGSREYENLQREANGKWRDYQHLLVMKEDWFEEPLPSKLGNQEVTFVTNQDLIERYSQKKQEIPITYMLPIQNNGSELTIHFRECWFSYKKKWRGLHLYLGLEGGCKVTLKYNAATDRFDTSKVEFWGI